MYRAHVALLPVTAAHDKRTSRTSELLELLLRNLEATKSKEDAAVGGRRDAPLDGTSEPALLQLRPIHHRRRSTSVGSVMISDKRTRDQQSPSPIPEPKKHATDLTPSHTIHSAPQ
ncbi:hypothetical protein EVAR_29873_1 [Eumeta japonica]|uniref:Uncharacterized protein n=1 Tax=Eumeta variegata TaxID=151549 RepID=A0A4C1V6K6_EUMVA|nr:hypothetical protein EVAR_29873_1 [Eumeta japonica]